MSVGVARQLKCLWTPAKPRIVLVLLVVASLAGRWLTTQTQATGFLDLLAGWLILLGLSVVVAAVSWRLTLFRWSTPSEAPAMFADRRFDLLALIGSSSLVAGAGVTAVLDPTTVAVTRLVAGVLAAGGIVMGTRYDSLAGYMGAVALGIVVLAVTAVEHFYGVVTVPAAVRFAHLGAVTVWLGGALWHNVILAPGIKRFPDAKLAFAGQAKSFRPVVLVAIAVVVLTGLFQSQALLGVEIDPYLTTSLGNAILLKLAIVGVLAVLVITSILRR